MLRLMLIAIFSPRFAWRVLMRSRYRSLLRNGFGTGVLPVPKRDSRDWTGEWQRGMRSGRQP